MLTKSSKTMALSCPVAAPALVKSLLSIERLVSEGTVGESREVYKTSPYIGTTWPFFRMKAPAVPVGGATFTLLRLLTALRLTKSLL